MTPPNNALGAPLWTWQAATAATGGKVSQGWQARGISIDSRAIALGDLFVALKGPNFDGHDYVAGAFDKGAAAAMVTRRPDNVASSADLIIVDDTMDGLSALARYRRAQSGARIVAVTGSVGKTGVKEALAYLLGRAGAAHASAGNLNNQIGAPLSLARMPAQSDYAVFELGMNHAGEIEPLSRLVRPHVAIVTTIAPVHMEFFASIEAIAEAKAEIFAGVEPGGTAVLNRDNPQYDLLALRAREAGIETIIGFGSHAEARFRLISVETDLEGSRIEAVFDGRKLKYRLSLPGRHQAHNSLAVLAAIHAAGADVAAAAKALAEIQPPKGRGARHIVKAGKIEFVLIDDSYNASPVSMVAALRILADIAPARSGRRIAVLGDMLELGQGEEKFHRDMAHDAEAAGIDLVFAAGPRMAQMYDALPAHLRGGRADTSSDLSPMVTRALRDGDVVLVKGSAGSKTGLIVRDLLALDPRHATASPAH
jgi:UDP-N-acetylmuramoyl-tripeptide--D-alanyl-D-alanine ligase